MPDRFGVPVVTMLVCFSFFAREAMGAACTRHSLRPLLERGTLVQDPDALASREDGRLAVQKPNRNALPSPSPGGGGSARKSEAKYVTGWGELIANASPHPAAHFTRGDPPPPREGRNSRRHLTSTGYTQRSPSLLAPTQHFLACQGGPNRPENSGKIEQENASGERIEHQG